MKKFVFTLVILTAIASFMPLVAQEAGSAPYYVNVNIIKVYPYSKGYVVKYQKGVMNDNLATAYLPGEWFTPANGKGAVVLLKTGLVRPSMSVFYKDGAFDHVKLYICKDRADFSWGYMPQGADLDARFEGVEDLTLEF